MISFHRRKILRAICKIIFITVILSISATGGSYAKEIQKEKIVILFGHRFPPFYSINKSNESSQNLKGLFIDILENFTKSHPQYKLEYKCLPRGRINKVLAAENADAFALTDPMFVSKEINSKFAPSLPLWKIGDHLLVRKNSDIIDNNIEDLRGKRIAVLHGNGYGPLDEYFDKDIIHKHSVYRTSQILELVTKRRVEGAICNEMTLPKLMSRSSHSINSFRIIEKPLYEYNLHLLIKRSKTDFLEDFNIFITKNKIPTIKHTVQHK
ncbi:ABC transporter substrate-binding protein [Maridesulfovibrio ferrireducens]|uniref:substrate-binding periplasmic protein n=1 Tax=Maridesulfovibrio ferrireducens TaxID=246191 RepID=UPI001A281939|nr:transporter substrate-binding domain-containing protein [Maridesulfovibrio ferrireducens]MBI9112551.1 transporter substrate-binding domain-containing protein [Maridesulfovibrio ferrireducens]